LGIAFFSGNAMAFAWLVYFMANPNAWLAHQEPVLEFATGNPQKRKAGANEFAPAFCDD
jgi:hypothetical protein